MKSHCVTYTRLYIAICNYAFKINGIHDYKATHVVGYVKCYNINLCAVGSKILKKYSNYFVNHDFVEITGNKYPTYIGACLFDLTGM